MFNRTTSTFSELGVLCAFARDGSHPIPDSHRAKPPRPQRMKSEFRNSNVKLFLGALCAFARDGSHSIPDSHRAKPVLSPSFVRINSAEWTPRPQRKIFSYFSELGDLCAFARGLVYPIP